MPETNLDFTTEPSKILELLEQSKEGGTCIAIKSEQLGLDVVITAVDDVFSESERYRVVLKHYDTSGYILPTNKLFLEDIDAVCPFSTTFKNPIQEQVDKDRPWFF